MLRKVLTIVQEYFERNEEAHKRAAIGLSGQRLKELHDWPDLPEDIANALQSANSEELYVLEILNDDLTPMGVVVELLELYCLKSYAQAHEIAVNTHTKGKSQVVTGPKEALESIAILIESSARSMKHPLKCQIAKI